MKFGSFPLEQCEGAILAHALKHGRVSIKKGQRLSGGDLQAIRQTGMEALVVAIPEAGDIDENRAAERLARALRMANVRIDTAGTGRVNLYAEADGLFQASRVIIDAINHVDPGITLATVDTNIPVNAGRMVGTVKIIPYMVAEASLITAEKAAATGEALGVREFRARPVGVISTRLPHLKESIIRKTHSMLEKRLAASGSELTEEVVVDHATEAVDRELKRQIQHCEMIVLFGASAISDRRDVIPQAIERAGGKLIRFGMPVDPGNLLLLAELDGKPVLGAPGCARSPAENGFDFILNRLMADIDVSGDEIAGMGVGGLLMEIGSRPQPRETARRKRPLVSAVVLAAGQSRRMGDLNKLTIPVAGVPVVRQVVDAAAGSACERVVVVTGHQREAVASALQPDSVVFAHNPNFADGLSTSLAAGIRALKPDCTHALILLGDMPGITSEMIDHFIDAAKEAPAGSILVATNNGKRGNPVLWPKSYFDALCGISGDTGARHLLGEYVDRIVEIELGFAASLDLDTPDALEAYRARKEPVTGA